MPGGASVDEQVLIGGAAHRVPHGGQTADELWDRQLELADEHTALRRDWESQSIGASGQRQRQVGDQQRFAHFRFPAHKQDALRGQQARFYEAGRWRGRLLFQELTQGKDRGCWGLAHNRASVVASSRIASFTADTLRAAASRRAVMTSLLTLRRMPLVAW